jgi:dihydroorotase
MTQSLTITQPDDWHIHLRDGSALPRTVGDAARYFRRAIVMPNLVPPIITAAQAISYRQRVRESIPSGKDFDPLMVLYLTDNTSAQDIKEARREGIVACKLYPAGATTNSNSGVTQLEKIYPVLETMQEQGLLLLIHGEVTVPEVDIFDREARFIDQHLVKLHKQFPELRIVLEHISTCEATNFVLETNDNLAATITAHHLLYNRNALLAGAVRPHYYCLPILKSEQHRQALVTAATSGSKKFFLGSDSAPHGQHKKEIACGCAGCYTGHATIELYAEVFDRANALDKLEAFASFYGADFYGLPRNQGKIILKKQAWQTPQSLPMGDDVLIPLAAGETLNWQVLDA